MTLGDYLNSLVLTSGRSLVWNKSKLTQDQLQQAGDDPYVVMSMGNVETRKRLFAGYILGRLIDLTIYVEPVSTDFLPSASELESLWIALFNAPKQVDEGLYGYDIIKLEYVGGLAPDLDERSSGLMAAVRFDWWYTQQLVPRV